MQTVVVVSSISIALKPLKHPSARVAKTQRSRSRGCVPDVVTLPRKGCPICCLPSRSVWFCRQHVTAVDVDSCYGLQPALIALQALCLRGFGRHNQGAPRFVLSSTLAGRLAASGRTAQLTWITGAPALRNASLQEAYVSHCASRWGDIGLRDVANQPSVSGRITVYR